MNDQVERRRPDRHLVAVRLLRGIAVAALISSVLLWIVPRVLTELGVLGPSPQEYVDDADRAINVARTYGAVSLPVFQKAEHERDRALEMVRTGQRREARHAAERAMAFAIEAQKQALVRRSDTQARAEAVYNDLDRQINDLERLYSEVVPGLEKEQVAQLLSLMKVTRAAAGAVFLAYEQQDWNGVLKAEAHAREVIAGTRGALTAARKARRS
jgi:hypothetical protein